MRSGGNKLDGENWYESTPMDTSHEAILEPETYIGDAISTDRINHDDIMEVTAPVNKAPSVIKSEEDKPTTPILKVADPGTTVAEKDPALVNKIRIMHARQGYDKTIGRFVARLHTLADISDPLTEYTKVDGTQDIVCMEPFLLVAFVKGLYDEATKNEIYQRRYK